MNSLHSPRNSDSEEEQVFLGSLAARRADDEQGEARSALQPTNADVPSQEPPLQELTDDEEMPPGSAEAAFYCMSLTQSEHDFVSFRN